MTNPQDRPVAEIIAEIRERADAATTGPWAWENIGDKGGAAFLVGTYYSVKADKESGDAPLLSGCVETETWDDEEEDYVRTADYDARIAILDDNPNPGDAEFIAHARADIPFLLAEHTRLSKRVEELATHLCMACWQADRERVTGTKESQP